jgi:hypothetical protein
MERAHVQARALIEGTVLRRREVPLPRGVRRELYLRIEVDPLDRGEPFLFSWGEGKCGGAELEAVSVVVASTDEERAKALDALVEVVESRAARDEPIYVYGPGSVRAFDALAEVWAWLPIAPAGSRGASSTWRRGCAGEACCRSFFIGLMKCPPS